MDTLNKHNAKIRESHQVLAKMRPRFPNDDKNVDSQASKEKKYVCSTPMQLPINRKLFDLNVVSASPIANQKSDPSLKTTVGHFKNVIYESDDETYESAQIIEKQTQKNMVCENGNKKTKKQTKCSLDKHENLDTNVFIPSSPKNKKAGPKNKIKTVRKIRETADKQHNSKKHIFKLPPSVKVLKRNKKEIQSSTKKSDVLSSLIVEERVKQTRNMEIRTSKLSNMIADDQINLENNIIQSDLLVAKKVIQNKHINITEDANNDKNMFQSSFETIINRGTHTSKNPKKISNNQENYNKNEFSYSAHQKDLDKEVSNPRSSVANLFMQNKKISTSKAINNGSSLELRASERNSCISKKSNQIVGEEEEDSNKNIYQSPLSVLQKHKNKLDTRNIINKVICNDVDIDKEFIENGSSVKKKAFQKKKINILKVSNEIMENPMDINTDMHQSSYSMCDEVLQKNKTSTSTMKTSNEMVNNQEYADGNLFFFHRSIDDEVLQNNIDEPNVAKITDDILDQNILHKDELSNSLLVVPSNKTDTISSKIPEKQSKNRQNISKMQEYRIPNKERTEADVSCLGQLNQVYFSSGDENEDEIIKIADNKDTRPVKRKMEKNGIVGCKNAKTQTCKNFKTQTFSERAISEQLPLGNNGQIDLLENGERKTIKCFGRFPIPQKESISVGASLHNSLFTAGIIELQPKAFLDTECSELFGLYYFVLEGTAEVGIGNCSKIMRLGDCCFVPKNASYYIVNISLSEKLIINFCKIC